MQKKKRRENNLASTSFLIKNTKIFSMRKNVLDKRMGIFCLKNLYFIQLSAFHKLNFIVVILNFVVLSDK